MKIHFSCLKFSDIKHIIDHLDESLGFIYDDIEKMSCLIRYFSGIPVTDHR